MFASGGLSSVQACDESASHDVSDTGVKGHVGVLCICFVVYCIVIKWDEVVRVSGGSNFGASRVSTRRRSTFPRVQVSRLHHYRLFMRSRLVLCPGEARVRPCMLRPGAPSYFSLDACWLLTCRQSSGISSLRQSSLRISFLSSLLPIHS